MTSDTTFVLDASVFIEAARRYYAFDIAPGFWENLIQHAAGGQLLSIDKVKLELEQGRDELADWAKDNFEQWFASTDNSTIIEHYAQIIDWVNGQSQFLEAAKADFAIGADGWLVAVALAGNHVLVTREQYDPNIRRRVPIPNVCQQFKVSYIDTFEMLRQLGITLS